MNEKFIELFTDEKLVDIAIRPTFTQIKIYNVDQLTADMYHYDIVKTAKNHDCLIVTYDDMINSCDEFHTRNDNYFHKFQIFKDGIIITIEIYFH